MQFLSNTHCKRIINIELGYIIVSSPYDTQEITFGNLTKPQRIKVNQFARSNLKTHDWYKWIELDHQL